MRRQQQEWEQKPMKEEIQQQVNMLVGIAQILSYIVRVWCSRLGTIGERYGGHQGILSIIAFPVGALMIAGPDAADYEPVLIGVFMLCTLARMFAHGQERRRLANQGIHPFHSQYGGTSVFWKTGDDEIRVKQHTESTVCVFAGIVTLILSKGLGIMFIVCGVANAIAEEFERLKQLAIERQLRDAMAEQEYARYMMDKVRKQ